MKMTNSLSMALALVCMFVLGQQSINAQEPDKQFELLEKAEAEADRLQRVLNLEDWQVFYVDSTLKHDFPAMMDECEKLQKSKVANASIYIAVQDKWMDKIDASYRRIFNEEQWAAYLRNGAARAQKAREKRKAKSEGLK